MHKLPPAGHPARELFEVEQLVAIVEGREPVHCNIWALRAAARRIFEASPAARRAAFIRVRPDNDQLELVTFGRRLAWRREWVFGPCGRNARLI